MLKGFFTERANACANHDNRTLMGGVSPVPIPLKVAERWSPKIWEQNSYFKRPNVSE